MNAYSVRVRVSIETDCRSFRSMNTRLWSATPRLFKQLTKIGNYPYWFPFSLKRKSRKFEVQSRATNEKKFFHEVSDRLINGECLLLTPNMDSLFLSLHSTTLPYLITFNLK